MIPSTLQRRILFSYPYEDLLRLTDEQPHLRYALDEDFWREKAFFDFSIDDFYWSLSPSLSGSDKYLRLYSQKGVTFGSQKFLDINLCLKRATQKGSEELFLYFLSLLQPNLVDWPSLYYRSLQGGQRKWTERLYSPDYDQETALSKAVASGRPESLLFVLERSSSNLLTDLSQPRRAKLLLKALTFSWSFFELLYSGMGFLRTLISSFTKLSYIRDIFARGCLKSIEFLLPQLNFSAAQRAAARGLLLSPLSDCEKKELIGRLQLSPSDQRNLQIISALHQGKDPREIQEEECALFFASSLVLLQEFKEALLERNYAFLMKELPLIRKIFPEQGVLTEIFLKSGDIFLIRSLTTIEDIDLRVWTSGFVDVQEYLLKRSTLSKHELLLAAQEARRKKYYQSEAIILHYLSQRFGPEIKG